MKEMYKFKVKNGESETEFSFVEPSKAIAREGEMLYAKEYAACVRNGLLTNAEALKLANDRGGIFTEEEKEDYVKKLSEYVQKDKELSEKLGSGEDVSALKDEVSLLKNTVVFYNTKQDAIYEQTAETKSRDNLIMFYALALTHKDGKCFFEGKDFAAKMKAIEDAKDDFKNEVFRKAIYYSTAMWYGIKDVEGQS